MTVSPLTVTVKITGIAQVNDLLRTVAPREAKNLLRATVLDMANSMATEAITLTPDNPNTGKGDLHTSIKAQRDQGTQTRIEASVRVMNRRRNFFWRFLEYGQSPDHVQHAMFGRAVSNMRGHLDEIYLSTFVRKLEARLTRLRVKAAKSG